MKGKLINRVVKMIENEDGEGIKTLYDDIDKNISGLKKGGIYLVGAKRGTGATSLLLGTARNIASQGKRVLFFSVTCDEKETVRRLLIQRAGDKHHHIIDEKECTEEEMERIRKAASELKKLPIVIDDMLCPNVISLADSMLINSECMNADVIIIDGLQYLTSSMNYVNRNEEIEAIFREISNSLYILDIPAIISVDITRETDNFDSTPPELSELKKYGSITEIAQAVLLLHREDMYNPGINRRGIMDINIYKRNINKPEYAELVFSEEYLNCYNIESGINS